MPDLQDASTSNTSLNRLIAGTMASGERTAKDIEARGKKAEAEYESAIDKAEKNKPQPPKFGDLPQRPKVDYGNPNKVFRDYGVLLILLASLTTRRPLAAAANAAASAMNGYRQGKLEQAKQAEQEWRDNLDIALKQNDLELEKYKAALESAETDERLAASKLQAAGAASRDEMMAATIRRGNMGLAVQLIRDREHAGRVLKSARNAQQKQEDVARLYGSALGQIDSAARMARDPGVIGVRGMLGRVVESTVGQTFGDKKEPSKAFENQLDNLRAAVRNLITKSHYMSAGSVQQLEDLVQGDSIWSTQTSTLNSLARMKAIIQSEQGAANSAISDEAEREASQESETQSGGDDEGWSITPAP